MPDILTEETFPVVDAGQPVQDVGGRHTPEEQHQRNVEATLESHDGVGPDIGDVDQFACGVVVARERDYGNVISDRR